MTAQPPAVDEQRLRGAQRILVCGQPFVPEHAQLPAQLDVYLATVRLVCTLEAWDDATPVRADEPPPDVPEYVREAYRAARTALGWPPA